MKNTYTADPNEIWDEEDDLNITRELSIAKTAGVPARDCSPEIVPPADPPQRWQQDTQRVDGEAALHPPPDGGRVQG